MRRPAVLVQGHIGEVCGGDFPGFSRSEIFRIHADADLHRGFTDHVEAGFKCDEVPDENGPKQIEPVDRSSHDIGAAMPDRHHARRGVNELHYHAPVNVPGRLASGGFINCVMTVLLSRTLFPSVSIAYPASICSADLHNVLTLVFNRFGLTICEIEP